MFYNHAVKLKYIGEQIQVSTIYDQVLKCLKQYYRTMTCLRITLSQHQYKNGVLLLVLGLFTVLDCIGTVESKARFLGHVPYDDDQESPDMYDQDYNYHDIHDSIVKLPGRHYPKLPYVVLSRRITFQSQRVNSYAPPKPSEDIDLASDMPSNEPLLMPLTTQYRKTNLIKTNAINVPINEEGDKIYQQFDPNTQQYGVAVKKDNQDLEENVESPRFDRQLARKIRVQEGRTAELVCRVFGLQQESVSWIRLKNLNILTISDFRYSTDRRVSVRHDHNTHRWRLRIARVTHQDAGAYECQISTKPVLSFVVELEVTVGVPSDTPAMSGSNYTLRDAAEDVNKGQGQHHTTRQHHTQRAPQASFAGPAELLMQPGDVINLTCLVTHTLGQLVTVNWYHYDRLLADNSATQHTNHHWDPLYINHYRDLQKSKQISADAVSSNTIIEKIDRTHNADQHTKTVFNLPVGLATTDRSGKYTCAPVGGSDASVIVNVTQGAGQLLRSADSLNGTNFGRQFTPVMTIVVTGVLLYGLFLYRVC